MKTFLVIGLGRFGSAAVETLFDLGYEVMALDSDQDLVQKYSDRATYAAVGDARDESVLRALDAGDFDCAIVALGGDLAASILITMNLKNLGVKTVICKAQNEQYQKALERVGADRVLIPEREMAVKTVKGLVSGSFHDYLEFSEDYGIAELDAPAKWTGKSLKELNVRRDYRVSVLALKDKTNGKVNMAPGAEDRIAPGCVLVVMGHNSDLTVLQNL